MQPRIESKHILYAEETDEKGRLLHIDDWDRDESSRMRGCGMGFWWDHLLIFLINYEIHINCCLEERLKERLVRKLCILNFYF